MKIIEENPTKITLKTHAKPSILANQILGLLVIAYACWLAWYNYQTWNAPTLEIVNEWKKISDVATMIFLLWIGWSAMRNNWNELYTFDKVFDLFTIKTNHFFKDRVIEYYLSDIVDVKVERQGMGYDINIALTSGKSLTTNLSWYGQPKKMRSIVDRIQTFLNLTTS